MNKVLIQGYLYNPYHKPPIQHMDISLDLDDVRITLFSGVREEFNCNGRHGSDPTYKARLLSIDVYFKRQEAPMYIYFIDRSDANVAWALISGASPAKAYPAITIEASSDCVIDVHSVKHYLTGKGYPCSICVDDDTTGNSFKVISEGEVIATSFEEVIKYADKAMAGMFAAMRP